MTNFKRIQSMNVDELAEWLDENGMFDNSPWSNWFNDRYCKNCESIKCKYADAEEKLGFTPYLFGSYSGDLECAYCELADESGIKRCRFFPELDDVPDNKKTIEMWLIEEAE